MCIPRGVLFCYRINRAMLRFNASLTAIMRQQNASYNCNYIQICIYMRTYSYFFTIEVPKTCLAFKMSQKWQTRRNESQATLCHARYTEIKIQRYWATDTDTDTHVYAGTKIQRCLLCVGANAKICSWRKQIKN